MGFPAWGEVEEIGKKLCNVVQYLAIEKVQRGTSLQNQGTEEPGLKGTESGKLKPPVNPLPPPPSRSWCI